MSGAKQALEAVYKHEVYDELEKVKKEVGTLREELREIKKDLQIATDIAIESKETIVEMLKPSPDLALDLVRRYAALDVKTINNIRRTWELADTLKTGNFLWESFARRELGEETEEEETEEDEEMDE